MKLIADSGGTGTDWALQNKSEITFFKGAGLHPDSIDSKTHLPDSLFDIKDQIDTVLFYGTGCANTQKAAKVKSFLASYFGKAKIKVYSDLLALAHPVFGHEHGLVGILGTGSSMCFYDGSSIHFEVFSPGKGIDPGSGSVIVEKVWKKYLNGMLSESINMIFQQTKKNSNNAINPLEVNKIVFGNLHDSSIRKVVEVAFEEYLNFYEPLWKKHSNSIVFGGTVAALGSAVLTEVVERNGIKIIDIVRYPIKRLVDLHLL